MIEETLIEETLDKVEENQEQIESSSTSADEGELTSKLKTIQDELDKKSELIKQLRKYERQQKEEKEKILKEQGDFKVLYEETIEKYNQLKGKLKNDSIDTAISEIAKNMGVKSISTLNKLIDKNSIAFDDNDNVDLNSVKEIIKGLQKSDPFLFEPLEVQTPSPKKATEEISTSNYEIELKKARTPKEIELVLKKYNKL